MYDSSFLDYLKKNIVLSDVVSRNINVIHKGRNKVACCPFHKEKTPSFFINDDKGFYHCFGCGEHGDIFTYVMKTDCLSFKDAIIKLAEENHIELPKIKNIIIEDNKIIYEINEKTCQFFEKNIINSEIAINYIKSRGLNINNINKFRIGYATNGFDNLINYLRNLGFKEEDMLKAGVIAFNNKYYDKFRNRIMFPVLDKNGKVIAFTGRVVNKEDMPKYMNSPETPIYHKSSILFNYFFAKKSIYDNKKSFLVEGNLDALSLYINGVKNVVAPMGTAVTIEQLEELWKICDEIIICLDGDNAGKKASIRVANMVLPILKPMKNISFVTLPDGEDPDDFIKKSGKNYFDSYINKNILSLSEFLWKNETSDIDLNKNINAEDRIKINERIKNILNNISNSTISKSFNDFYKSKMFYLTRYKNEFDYKSITKIDYSKNMTNEDIFKQSIINIEKNIFYIIINNIKVIDKIFQDYNIDIFNINFSNIDSNKILDIFLNIYELNLFEDKNFLINILEKNNFSDYITNSYRYDKFSYDEKVKFLYNLILERNINILQLEIKKSSLNNENEMRRKNLIFEMESIKNKKDNLENIL